MWRPSELSEDQPIDFVVTWVDGDDSDWIAQKARYVNGVENGTDSSARRYRDWGLLRYTLRSIEYFAPWVRSVYLITCGHLPSWLNHGADKLVLVKHTDYIPDEYLPTFSSRPIELNLHRLDGLSECFVNFNDDMVLTREVSRELFFRNGLPVITPAIHAIDPWGNTGVMAHNYLNNVSAVNRHFDYHQALRRNVSKWFNPWRLGMRTVIENIWSANYAGFPGFRSNHLPQPLLKSTIRNIWEYEGNLLHETCMHRVRNILDVSVYLLWEWQLATGKFIPINSKKLGAVYDIRVDTLEEISDSIIQKRHRMICANDMGHITSEADFYIAKEVLAKSFEVIMPLKSQFEI